ncbi:outer membrane beta-barrel protein [Sphingomonas nostoxanthinifaciens]|uniref:outer membrane beta-barrel protein n=1 Tax=Sphingomonas nostoxanthinifaciens TaxID=2872652 RepID=UPI001CC1EFC1|nr:outer membrane beta-barrel protein [Sphingomonas nostoxanthinifaciens]UAK23396.1 outer membrane beta-barrel protein [Sphingomonas nostoxanthinifaciens]
MTLPVMGLHRPILTRALLLALTFMLSSPVYAQAVDALTTSAGNFKRDRSIAVLDRLHPEFDPQGINLGSFVLLPKVDVTARGTDNLYATDSDRRSDVAGVVDPSFKLNSNWSRNWVTLAGDAAITRYADHGSENVETYDVNGAGQYDIDSQSYVRGFVDYGRLAERRSDVGTPNNTVTPIRYNSLNAIGTAQWQSSRFKLVASGGVNQLRYSDNVTFAGAPASQGYRDRNSYRGTARGEYALTPDVSLLVQGTASFQRYTQNNQSAFNRNSDRQELLGGISMELTQLVRAEAGVGYIHLTYKQPGLQGFSGIGARAQVQFFPSQLTTVSLKASRTIEDSGLPTAPSYVRSLVALQVDHELLRNLILSGSAQYSNNDFNLQARQEHRPEFFARAIYTLDRHFSLTARYDHIESHAQPFGLGGKTFALNQLTLTLSARI